MDSGRREQGVICIVHGMGEHSGRYADMAGFLNQQNYSVLALDLPGHGKTSGKRGHISSYQELMDSIDILLQEADRRYPDLPAFLYGHSMGGNLVINYTLRRKPEIEGLIVSAPWLRLGSEPPLIKAFLGKMMNYIVPGFSQSNGLLPSLLSHDKKIVEKYQNDPLVHDQISARFYVEISDAGKWALENTNYLNVDTLLMVGSDDQIISVDAIEEFASLLGDNLTLKKWDGFYHEIHNENGKENVYEYLSNWIKDRETN